MARIRAGCSVCDCFLRLRRCSTLRSAAQSDRRHRALVSDSVEISAILRLARRLPAKASVSSRGTSVRILRRPSGRHPEGVVGAHFRKLDAGWATPAFGPRLTGVCGPEYARLAWVPQRVGEQISEMNPVGWIRARVG